jgi:hypothetical protein
VVGILRVEVDFPQVVGIPQVVGTPLQLVVGIPQGAGNLLAVGSHLMVGIPPVEEGIPLVEAEDYQQEEGIPFVVEGKTLGVLVVGWEGLQSLVEH